MKLVTLVWGYFTVEVGQIISRFSNAVQQVTYRLRFQLENSIELGPYTFVEQKLDIIVERQVVQQFRRLFTGKMLGENFLRNVLVDSSLTCIDAIEVMIQRSLKFFVKIGVCNLSNYCCQHLLISIIGNVEPGTYEVLQRTFDIFNIHHILCTPPEVFRGIITGHYAN